jgi:hypothetical protein
MTLPEQISLIDQMISENPDYTIRDYFDLLAEIESVADSLKIKRYPTLAENGPFIFHQSIITDDHHRKTHAPLRFYGSGNS